MTALHAFRPPVSEPGAATRERILEAAEALFADQGFAAPVRQITAGAGCNLAAVSYHFGGKERLYEEVFRSRLRPLREQRLQILRRHAESEGDRDTLEQFLRAYAAAFLETWVESRRGPAFLRLLSREMIEPHLPEGFLAEFFEPVHAAFSTALQRLAPGLEPARARLASHSFVGLLMEALNVRRCYGNRSGEASLELSVLTEHAVQLVAGGIRSLAPQRPARRAR